MRRLCVESLARDFHQRFHQLEVVDDERKVSNEARVLHDLHDRCDVDRLVHRVVVVDDGIGRLVVGGPLLAEHRQADPFGQRRQREVVDGVRVIGLVGCADQDVVCHGDLVALLEVEFLRQFENRFQQVLEFLELFERVLLFGADVKHGVPFARFEDQTEGEHQCFSSHYNNNYTTFSNINQITPVR